MTMIQLKKPICDQFRVKIKKRFDVFFQNIKKMAYQTRNVIFTFLKLQSRKWMKMITQKIKMMKMKIL